jgi:hypothetical protein
MLALSQKAKSTTHRRARKLLIYANTVVQRGTPWIEKPLSV